MPKKPSSEKKIESFVHDDASRRNIPPAEYQTMVRNQEKTPCRWPMSGGILIWTHS